MSYHLTTIWTLTALFAFAANSVFCRLALSVEQVTPAEFTSIRLLSAALTLVLLIAFKRSQKHYQIRLYGGHLGAISLLVYALGFSYAYVTLGTATGALILFASVQFTMLFAGMVKGHTTSLIEKLGITCSLLGFIYFMYPELEKPSLVGCLLMVLAGIAWGIYSLIGAKSSHPLFDTASNFIRLIPIMLTLLIGLLLTDGIDISLQGWLYSIGSGALASGIGYSIWYAVLPQLKSSIAAVCQLSVPIWAALGGVILVAEPITLHLMLSASLILGGILLVIITQKK